MIAVSPVSVVIPVRNEGTKLSRCIMSIIRGRSCSFPLEIVVVDDGSTDGCCDALQGLAETRPNVKLVLLRLKGWYGVPYARNRGMEAATSPICFMTDGNTIFSKNWDLSIWKHFDRRRLLAGTIADLSSSFRGYGCTLLVPSMGIRWLSQSHVFDGYIPVVACSSMVIDRSLFFHLGGYDETLPLYGAAEPEFSVRAWLSGYEIVNDPELIIHHSFKPRPAYDAFRQSIRDILIGNYIRFACYYLPDALLQVAYDHYGEDLKLRSDLSRAALQDEGVWERREYLAKTLPRSFDWLMRRFSLSYSEVNAA